MSVTERLYYSDSFLKAFTGEVTHARDATGPQGSGLWKLALNRTAFYPTSGGQPYDTGVLTASTPAGAVQEVAVEEVEEEEDGGVWHLVREKVEPGTKVEGLINWDRRFDHMQQHTGQHLLSAVFFRELQAATVSFHLGEAVSTIDLAIGPLAHHSLERIERIANELIGEDRPVLAGFVSRADAEDMLARGLLRKLPEREGSMRMVEIADCDLNACGGTHVRSTGQIGGLLVRGVEKVSRGIRVEFVCGLRAVRTARAEAAVISEVGALLSAGATELASTVNRLLGENKAGLKERQRLREELAGLQAAQIAAEARTEGGLRVIVREWKDRDRDYVKLLASRTAAASSSTAVVFVSREAEPFRVFVARSKDVSFNCGQILREALAQFGLRGGGSPDLAQGDIAAQQEPELRALLVEAVRDAS